VEHSLGEGNKTNKNRQSKKKKVLGGIQGHWVKEAEVSEKLSGRRKG